MKVVEVSRENWNDVDEAIAEDGVLLAVRVHTSAGPGYDLSIGSRVYRLTDTLAQELAREDKLSPNTYVRLFMAGFRRRN
jgi:hypothetical protein